MATAGPRDDACGCHATIPSDSAEQLCLLRHMDQVRHVSACGKVSPGLSTVVAVPGVLVHSVEGHATGLHGSSSGAHDVPWDAKSASLEKFIPPWTVRRQVWSDGLNIFYFKRKGITNKHKAYEWLSRMCGRIHWSSVTRVSRLTSCYSVISTCRWYITTGSISSCVLCYLRRWLSRRIVCCYQFRPALCRHVRLARPSWCGSLPEGPDAPSGGYGWYVSQRDRLSIFRFSRFRIPRTYMGRWSMTVGLRCSLCRWR